MTDKELLQTIKALRARIMGLERENQELKKEIERYVDGIRTIIKNTNCDDTWDFANRLLDGKENSELPYRFSVGGAKKAWVLQLKPEIAKEHYDGKVLYLAAFEYTTDNDYLTENIQEADVYLDREKAIQNMKNLEEFIYKKFGPNAICTFGYTDISENFDWVEIELKG